MIDLYAFAMRWMFVAFTVMTTGIGLTFLVFLALNLCHLVAGKVLDIAGLVEAVIEAKRQGRELLAWRRIGKKARHG